MRCECRSSALGLPVKEIADELSYLLPLGGRQHLSKPGGPVEGINSPTIFATIILNSTDFFMLPFRQESRLGLSYLRGH
jgi:hypothetical protein